MTAGDFAQTGVVYGAASQFFCRGSGQAQRHADAAGLLETVVEEQIIPRLIVAGTAARRRDAKSDDAATQKKEYDVRTFLDLLIDGRYDVCEAYLHTLRQAGMPLEAIYLDLFEPAARLLGPMWLDDELDFVEVSLALSRLQVLIIKIARSEDSEQVVDDPSRSVLLARARGELHAFGLTMVSEFFRLAGWRTDGGADLEVGAELIEAVRTNRYAVLALTAGTRAKALPLRDDICAVRHHSLNPDIEVLVGGSAFEADPDLCAEIGADRVAKSGAEAVEWAESRIAAAQ